MHPRNEVIGVPMVVMVTCRWSGVHGGTPARIRTWIAATKARSDCRCTTEVELRRLDSNQRGRRSERRWDADNPLRIRGSCGDRIRNLRGHVPVLCQLS